MLGLEAWPQSKGVGLEASLQQSWSQSWSRLVWSQSRVLGLGLELSETKTVA